MYVPKYRSYSEVKKNRNVVDIWNKFQQVVSLFLICYNALWDVFGKWRHFQRNAGDQIFLVHKGYWWKLFEQIVGLLVLLFFKSSHRRCSAKKRALKNLSNFTGKHLCWCHFLIKLQASGPATFLKWDSNTCVSPVKFVKLVQKKYFWNSASLSSQIIVSATLSEVETLKCPSFHGICFFVEIFSFF